ncbi:ATP-binding protein [Candidatus Woesearchaeota archaeon]|nr:ATP-binding protein [Candidatus Woesearchaeota archaeon]
MKGQVISGEFGRILIRQKAGQHIEIGEILVADTTRGKILLEVSDLLYGSQLSQQSLEMISGMKLEEDIEFQFFDQAQRSYTLAACKPLLAVQDGRGMLSKTMPSFFSEVREITKEDVAFLTTPKHPLFLGKLRSGSKTLDVDIILDGRDVFSHHILIAGTTGRGKSVLVANIIWDTLEHDYCSILVLDPHDEYYGRDKAGLKDHPGNKVVYYSKSAPPGCRTLKINLKSVRPQHLSGVVHLSDPQRQAVSMYYRTYGERWVESIILEKKLNVEFFEATLAVIRRRLMSLLNIDFMDNMFVCRGIFDFKAGETTIDDVCAELEQGKAVIVDTSTFSGAVELLIGSMVASEIFNRYKSYKIKGQLADKPVVSVILEEAPRVLGRDALEKGGNIFETIAREGRKFRVGLTAITQLPSLIPREILANMNTKIILGIEMAPERQAIIDSASQDLSQDNRTIASLDKGEAIITSNFARFATPIKIPLFEERVRVQQKGGDVEFSELR